MINFWRKEFPSLFGTACVSSANTKSALAKDKKTMATKNESSSLAIVEQSPILTGDEDAIAQIQDVMAEAIADGETVSFTNLQRIRWPAGGATTWELPGDETGKALDCVIIERKPVKGWWKEPFSGTGAPPDCTAGDNIHGVPISIQVQQEFGVGGECAQCPMNEWGSARGPDGEQRRGKACRQITRLFLICGTEQMPVLLNVPPSSATRSGRITSSVLPSRGQPYHGRSTRITLERATAAIGGTLRRSPSLRRPRNR